MNKVILRSCLQVKAIETRNILFCRYIQAPGKDQSQNQVIQGDYARRSEGPARDDFALHLVDLGSGKPGSRRAGLHQQRIWQSNLSRLVLRS